MKFTVRISDRALRDITGARDWYDDQVSSLGQEFGVQLDLVFQRLAEQPLMFGMIHRHVRRALTRRFPYAIYFVIDDDRVTILRVLHQARKPSAWKR